MQVTADRVGVTVDGQRLTWSTLVQACCQDDSELATIYRGILDAAVVSAADRPWLVAAQESVWLCDHRPKGKPYRDPADSDEAENRGIRREIRQWGRRWSDTVEGSREEAAIERRMDFLRGQIIRNPRS